MGLPALPFGAMKKPFDHILLLLVSSFSFVVKLSGDWLLLNKESSIPKLLCFKSVSSGRWWAVVGSGGQWQAVTGSDR